MANELQRYARFGYGGGRRDRAFERFWSRADLIRIIVDDAKNWLAHDGLWFQAAEGRFGIDVVIEADIEAWRYFTVIEAKRIMQRLGLPPGGGSPPSSSRCNTGFMRGSTCRT